MTLTEAMESASAACRAHLPSLRELGTLFFISGASSLIFETLFTRLLTYTFGNTAYAVSTVLAAFLGGLALGAYVLGRWADRVQPSILIYGGLELAIGCYGVLVPLLFAAITRAYVAIYHGLHPAPAVLMLIRFCLAALVILIPSTLMGGTLPVVARIVAATRPKYHSEIDWLYGLNTFGAAAGVLLSTYLLMPEWGVWGAIFTACLMNCGIFLYTFSLAKLRRGSSAHEAGDFPARGSGAGTDIYNKMPTEVEIQQPAASVMNAPGARGFVLIAAFLTGLITLSYEVVWTHALAFLVGNAVYSFGIMLFTFLCGLAGGAQIVSRIPGRASAWAWAFAVSQLTVGCVVGLTLPLWNRVPALFQIGVETTLRADLLAVGGMVMLRLIYLAIAGDVFPSFAQRSATRLKEIVAHVVLLACLAALWIPSAPPLQGQISGLWRYPATYFVSTEAFRFLISFYLLILPALCLGIAFPSLLNLFNCVREQTGKTTGGIYAANTIGAILGSLLTGFVVLQALGSYSTLWLAAILNVGLGLTFFALMIPAKRPQKIAVWGAAAAVLAVFATQPSTWVIQELISGSYVYFSRQWQIDKVLYAREDVQGGLTTVVQWGDSRTLLSNGKFQGNDTGEIPAQIRFAMIPMLFTHQFNRALIIGLGTGNSLRSLSAFPFQHIDVAELAPAIIDAARKWFRNVNGDVMDRDPRVHVIVADGRNHLLLSQDKYDLITIEVTSIWISGEGDIYNKEFYELCRSRLTQSGVLQQWVQVHHMRPQDFQVVLNTAAQVFPHVAFFLGPEQGLLIASASPLSLDYSQITSFDHDPGIRHELDIIHRHSMAFLMGEMVLYDQSYRNTVAALSRWSGLPEDLVSSDEYPYLEYQSPKGNVLPLTFLLDAPNLVNVMRARHEGLPSNLAVRNIRDSEDRDYLAGMALEEIADFSDARGTFGKIKGPNQACAEAEIGWIQGIERRLKDQTAPMPADPPLQCP